MPVAAPSPALDWTCPFCALLCDEFALDPAGPTLRGSECPRAIAALRAHAPRPARAFVDGVDASIDDAIAAAGQRLASWRQPLFGGLGVDVAGARALYRLAQRCGAICDHVDGAAMMHGLRALQDRGYYSTTLAEVATRADLVLCVGTPAVAHYPEFFRRAGLLAPDAARPRTLAFLGAAPPAGLPPHLEALAVAGSGDTFADLQQLGALAARRQVRAPRADLVALAERLRAARYAVLVWEAGELGEHGALWAEALHRLVATLNESTRAASLPLGGSDGAATANQVFTWLSGLPLRSRAGIDGLEHEPVRFDAARLLADGAVDGVLWIASFDPRRLPPATPLPRVVLGPPALGDALRDASPAASVADCVFVPVATPGLNAAGHLFRTDGNVVVPLSAVRDDGLPGVDAVLVRLLGALA